MAPITVVAALISLYLGAPEQPSGPVLGGDLYFAGLTKSSSTRVREGSLYGNYLHLVDDLGIPVAVDPSIQGGWKFTADDVLVLSIGHLFLWGGARLHHDIDYNGGTFQGGTQLSSRPLWLVFDLEYDHALFRFGENDRGYLAAEIGLRLDFVSWKYTTHTFAPTSIGHEAGENFGRQWTPIPFFGLAVRVPITESLDFVANARGMRVNHIDSLRKEGGTIYYSQSFIEANLGLAVTLSDGVQLGFGYRLLYLDIGEESHEDGNHVYVVANGAFVQLAVTF